MDDKFLKYYSRKDVQKRIVESARGREIAVKFVEGFGKRPDILQYQNDVLEFAKRGATSFHISEERWDNPLMLKPGMTRKQLDDLRKGWDLIIDIDTKFLEYAKIAADLIIEAFKFYNLNHFSVKFSGGNGFHIGVPFESFPADITGIELKNYFPDGLRVVANCIKGLIKNHLSERILAVSNINEIAKTLEKKPEELTLNGKFNPFTVLDLDPVLISSRHMFRAPYSINEKRNLVSIPVKNPLKFNIKDAKIENVETEMGFLDDYKEGEASDLWERASEFRVDILKREDTKSLIKGSNEKTGANRNYNVPKIAIKNEELFPPCVKLMIIGVKEDGRKRAVLIMINYFKSLGWSLEEIENYLIEWNKKNYEPLRDGYIISQINWQKKNNQNILPPNCDNASYMKGIGVCKPDNFCRFIKNPAQYTLKKIRMNENKKGKK